MVRRLGGYSPYEDEIGFSRVVVLDNGLVLVSGTTSFLDGAVRHPGDAGAQLTAALETVGRALADAGTDLAHAVSTRMYVVGAENCEAVGRAHAAVFRDVRPVATMVVVAGLIHPDMLAEIEVEAVLPQPDPAGRPRVVPV